MRRGRLQAALVVAVFGAAPAAPKLTAQASDTTFYFFRGSPRTLVLHLDTLGVHTWSGISSDSIVALLQPLGVTSVRTETRGLHFAALTRPQDRADLVSFARTAVAMSGGTIRHAGFAVRAPPESTPGLVADNVIAAFAPGVTSVQIDSLNLVFGVQVAESLSMFPGAYILTVTDTSPFDAVEVANAYHQSGLVRFASPEFFAPKLAAGGVRSNVTASAGRSRGIRSTEPLLADQWHLDNPQDHDIDGPEAWGLTQGLPETVIAILEAWGFDLPHEDLDANVITALNFFNCDEDNPPPGCGTASFTPENRAHGNAVAGLAAAVGDNGKGGSGVCPKCGLILIELPLGDGPTADVVAWVVEQGADVINNSWTQSISNDITDAAFKAAATADNVVVVWASYDSAEDRCGPGTPIDLGSEKTAILVAASNDLDSPAKATGFGACLDLLAPGYAAAVVAPGDTADLVGIVTTDALGSAGYNILDAVSGLGCKFIEAGTPPEARHYTRCFSGGSAAAPIVSGVAGLIRSRNPALTREQVMDILYRTADKVGYHPVHCPADPMDPVPPAANPAAYDSACPIAEDAHSDTHGHGRVNAYRALLAVPLPEPEVEEAPPVVEIGPRMGFTSLNGGIDEDVWDLPGSGPLAVPALYIAWFPVTPVYLELQLGGIRRDAAVDERTYAMALQPGVMYAIDDELSAFLAGSVAFRSVTPPTTADTHWGFGGASGLRYTPTSFLALRLEGRFRHWSTLNTDEWGIAFAFGVVLN